VAHTAVSVLSSPTSWHRVHGVVPDPPGSLELNMISTCPMLRLSLIAFLAILGSLFSAGGALACNMSQGRHCATAAPCGCCGAPASATPNHGIAESKTTSCPGPLQTTPSGRCLCGAEPPAAPEPRPGQGPTDNRTALTRHLGLPQSSLLHPYPLTLARSFPLTASPMQRTPLYLRTSRLLI